MKISRLRLKSSEKSPVCERTVGVRVLFQLFSSLDFFNPGRGFAFLEFSSNEEAQACIAAMDNTDVAGRTIQMNIARPKETNWPAN